MTPYGNLTLGEIVEAAERRAATGEPVHPGFDFASLAPSPLKQAQFDAELAEIAQAEPETHAGTASPGIEGDLDNAWARLKRSINP
ncbi:MAG: hypothetical protein ACRDKI_12140 [Solirubrobacterales bacterium]